MPPTNFCSPWPVCRRSHRPSQHPNARTHITVVRLKQVCLHSIFATVSSSLIAVPASLPPGQVPHLPHSTNHKKLGCPIHRALCDGWDVNRPPATEPLFLLLPCRRPSPPPKQRTVISTEAAHSLTVSSAVEKSASLPPLSPGQRRALAFACSPPLAETARVPHPSRICEGWDVNRWASHLVLPFQTKSIR
jgi:hypothetical protein